MITGKDIHERYALLHFDAKPWDEISVIAKRLYAAIARELNEERDIVAVKCPMCCVLIDPYAEHLCTSSALVSQAEHC